RSARPVVGARSDLSSLGSFVWSIADQLRGVYKPHQYGNVILPLTILRRLDCILEPSRDEVRALAAEASPDRLAVKIRQQFGLNFFNTSNYDFQKLVEDPDNLRSNLIDYINRFSDNVDVFERFAFAQEIGKMDEKGRLYEVVSQFAAIDLHPDKVPNAEMGDLFEELIRKFAESSNETAGEHFTPRDAIHLMVDLLFAEDTDGLTKEGVVRTVYDPTAGTGGMLTIAEDHLQQMNPGAHLGLYGQEINDQSYAICKSDMIAKGQDVSNIQLGDTLREDLFPGKTFDFCLSNPPYGVDWKSASEDVKNEVRDLGKNSRFPGGLPKISDGQMLFLQHLVAKMKPAGGGENGGRAGIVLNGSPLFNGGAGSGESEIRRYLLEHDLVEAIVALPTSMFYNTGIATYVWILDNTKQKHRVGKVQLIDGTSFFTKMRKNLGDKSREVSDQDRRKIVEIYRSFKEGEHSKIFNNGDFGYWTITVERPLKLKFEVSPERVDVALEAKPLAKVDHEQLRAALAPLAGKTWINRDEFLDELKPALKEAGLKLGAPAIKALWQGLSERDETAEVCTDKKGNPEPDTSLRDTENVPFGEAGEQAMETTIAEYFEKEVLPWVPDAWIDHAKTKVGYEIPFTRHFYKYEPPRPLEEIDRDLEKLTAEIVELLREVEG
ncbi:MAG: SAM-dependent DNA methyltransferase, partial [Solirubrobacterales bacterium]|nr:SAM-dependent DNA methyltransferase [Solirubrobacterales bacterium]